jgi:hypothetical protein
MPRSFEAEGYAALGVVERFHEPRERDTHVPLHAMRILQIKGLVAGNSKKRDTCVPLAG